MVKIKEQIKMHQMFLDQLRKLLMEFYILTSKISLSRPREDRKDGKISCNMGFSILSNRRNILNFHKKFKLQYALRKQKIFDRAIKKFIK